LLALFVAGPLRYWLRIARCLAAVRPSCRLSLSLQGSTFACAGDNSKKPGAARWFGRPVAVSTISAGKTSTVRPSDNSKKRDAGRCRRWRVLSTGSFANMSFQRKRWKYMLACMSVEGGRTVKKLTDPRALRALAHPTRLALVGVLRREGPLTATRAGELLGQSSASCSFHLRQLAKYGLVEEAGGGTGRERPWRATTMFTSWPDVADDPELAAATDMFAGVLAERYFEYLRRWLETRHREPEAWQKAAGFGDTMVYVTAEELAELLAGERALVDRYLDRQDHPELRPPGARRVTYLHLAFPGDISGAVDDGQPGSGER
jgi:DNA-binding transcriptional ArsR family regulator